jgi:hypothetical protein
MTSKSRNMLNKFAKEREEFEAQKKVGCYYCY